MFEEVPARALEQLGDHLDGQRMRTLLVDAGLMRDVAATGDPDAPQDWLAAIRQLSFDVIAAEDALAASRRAPTWLRFQAPPYWFLWAPALAAAAVGASLLVGHTFEERGLMIARFGVAFATVAVAVVGWTVWHNVASRRAIAREQAAARLARDQARADLRGGVTALLGRSFAARLDDRRVLLHTPHLQWVEARLADLRVAGRMPEVVDLESDLVLFRDTLRVAEGEVRRSPPETWVSLDHDLLLQDAARRWDRLGLPRRTDDAGQWAVLGLFPED